MANRIEVAYEATSQEIKTQVEQIKVQVDDTGGVLTGTDGNRYEAFMLNDIYELTNEDDFYTRCIYNSPDVKGQTPTYISLSSLVYHHVKDDIYIGIDYSNKNIAIIDVDKEKVILYKDSLDDIIPEKIVPVTTTFNGVYRGRFVADDKYIYMMCKYLVNSAWVGGFLVIDAITLDIVGLIKPNASNQNLAALTTVTNMLKIKNDIVIGSVNVNGLLVASVTHSESGVPNGFNLTLQNFDTSYSRGIALFKDYKDETTFYGVMCNVTPSVPITKLYKLKLNVDTKSMSVLGTVELAANTSVIPANFKGEVMQGLNSDGENIGYFLVSSYLFKLNLDRMSKGVLTNSAAEILIDHVSKDMIVGNGEFYYSVGYYGELNVETRFITLDTDFSQSYQYEGRILSMPLHSSTPIGTANFITMIRNAGASILHRDKLICRNPPWTQFFYKNRNREKGATFRRISKPIGYVRKGDK